MGTQLFAAGLAPGDCGMLWNVEHPDRVRAVHAAYRAAGCDFITANSFGGTSSTLARHGVAARVGELNRAAARLAREAAGDDAWVLGDVGPFGDFLEPLGETTAAALLAIFREQIAALLAGGADAILIETMSDPAEVAVAVAAAKKEGAAAVFATFAFQHAGDTGFRTMMGTAAGEAVRQAVAAGADAVGANCGTSLSLADYVALTARLAAAAGGVPVIAQPNAGTPEMAGGQAVYRATPADMAAAVPRLLAAGARIVGGCCGTTPAHLAAIGRAARAGRAAGGDERGKV